MSWHSYDLCMKFSVVFWVVPVLRQSMLQGRFFWSQSNIDNVGSNIDNAPSVSWKGSSTWVSRCSNTTRGRTGAHPKMNGYYCTVGGWYSKKSNVTEYLSPYVADSVAENVDMSINHWIVSSWFVATHSNTHNKRYVETSTRFNDDNLELMIVFRGFFCAGLVNYSLER